MIEYWTMVIAGVVAVAAVISCAYLYAESRELRFLRNRQKLKVYNDLLCAVTRLTVAGGDAYALSQAKRNLAFVLNRVNLVAGPEVLGHVNELLDFLNETREGGYDVLKEKNILNAIVQAARTELDPESARVLEEARFRYRFYNPPRT
ncbi:MAG: hypothetical protein QHH04_08950 [Methanolinea sp.]|nr:hypothetical protein [Methanolinea sp.]